MADDAKIGRIPVVDQIQDIASKTAYMPMQAFLQWSQTILLLAVIGGGFAVYRQHAAQLERIQTNTNDTNVKVALAQQELSHAVAASTMEQRETRSMVLTHLLGLKKDTENIKKGVGEIPKEPKDVFGFRQPRKSGPMTVEILPMPEVVPD